MYGKGFKEPYWGSSKYLNADIKEYGLWNFSKDIIEIYPFIDKKELLDRETLAMKEFNTLNPNGYNRYEANKRNGFSIIGTSCNKGNKFRLGKIFTQESLDKIIKTRKEQGSPWLLNNKNMLGKHQILFIEEL
jgi:hypothetical protein